MNAEKPDPTPSGPAAPLMSTALGVGLMTYPFQGGSNLI